MITRTIQSVIEKRLFHHKAIILIGARQVGKSTLFQNLIAQSEAKALCLNCDEVEVKNILTNINIKQLQLLIADNKILYIDEAQRVPNIGLTLKLITDNFLDVQLLITGSSSLNLHNSLDESLTGRKIEYNLFPISTAELMTTYGYIAAKQMLPNQLIYGSYPDIITHQEDAKVLLRNLISSYLYKDILEDSNIRKPVLLEKLLIALALQVGSEVSYNELAQTLGTDSKTVEKYIDLLEKCFVVFKLNALSRNVRNELKKSKKIYFYDNGVRNAILNNFAPLELRNDVGSLWENFIISERIKRNLYNENFANIYFWRTIQGQEIDFIEEQDGLFTAFEMKYNPRKCNTKLPNAFLENYPIRSHAIITPDNYMEYL